jgi:broad specificity phosphatase PhoE
MYPDGAIQSHAFGLAFRGFVSQHRLDIVEVHASQTTRTTETRELALEHMPGLTAIAPTPQLWEHRKGDKKLGGLEGVLRSEAYPDEATRRKVKQNWDFRHGTLESGGETAREAGERWLRWFNQVVERPNFQPRVDDLETIPTIVAFGHNAVTAYGITLLNHDGKSPLPPTNDRTFRVRKNATALLLAERDGQWSVLPERIEPTPAEFREAEAYIDMVTFRSEQLP